MARRFGTGMLAGGGVGVVALAVASLLADLPRPPQAQRAAPAGADLAAAPSQTADPAADLVIDAGSTVETAQNSSLPIPSRDTPVTPQGSPATPQVGADAAAQAAELAQPEGEQTASLTSLQPGPDGAVTATRPADLTQAGTDQSVLVARDTPARPKRTSPAPKPQPEPEQLAAAPASDTAIIAEPAPDAPAIATQTPAPAAPADTARAGTLATPSAPEPGAKVPLAEAARPPQSPEIDAPAEIDQPDAAEAAPEPPDTAPANGIELTQNTAPTRVRIGRPAASLLDRSQSANALPGPTRISVTPAPQQANQDASSPAPQGPQPALMQYAAEFENAEGRPLVSIILMDSGQGGADDQMGLEALQSFPYPLTFAVDIGLEDAQARMDDYRAGGFEVMAMINLPENLTASDTEVALSASLNAVTGAVAVMEGAQSGLQGNRALSDQVASVLLESGHGIVWQPKGLNTAQKLAAREGVPSRTLFRDIDGDGQTPAMMRRTLDQAAFRAAQDGAVVMVGRVQPDTISALLLWGLQDRANRIAVAPVSAVLRADQPGG